MTLFSSLAMQLYFIEPRTRKHVRGYRFLSFSRNHQKQLLDTILLKIALKKIVHKAGEVLGNEIAD